VLNNPIQLIGPASLVGNSRETFHQSGTDGSNPVPSSEESIANLISALRWGTAGAGERFSTMLACETSREIIKRLVSLTPALVSSAIQTTGF